MKLRDLTGQRFGRLVVLKRGPNQGRHVRWTCQCDCGTQIQVSSTNLVQGKSRSCGCLHIDIISTHRQTGSPEHKAWVAMKARCYTRSNVGYPIYGARGITVCAQWRDSFENFLADMGRKPSPAHSLDRINSAGHYSPENCRWATRLEQSNNMRSNRPLAFNGQTQNVSEWARELGLSKNCILYRLSAGWSVDRALSTPSSRPRKR